MGLEQLLSRINGFRKSLKELYFVEKAQRDTVWHEKVQILSNGYKNSLQDIRIGKIVNEHLFNVSKTNRIKDNKIYFIVQTSQSAAVLKPLQDALDINALKEYITVIKGIQGKYFINAIYVIEVKNVEDLNFFIENVEQNTKLKDKFLGNQSELIMLKRKEIVFEIFYKRFLNQESNVLNESLFNIEDCNNDITINIPNSILIDITFDKYVEDNIDRILNYEKYHKDSWIEYLNLYKNEDVYNKNDKTDF
jgi:hypothetical protein